MKKSLFMIILFISLSCNQNEKAETKSLVKETETKSERLIDGKLTTPPTDTISVIPTRSNDINLVFLDALTSQTFYNIYLIEAEKSNDEIAWEGIAWAWNDNGPCTQTWICFTYVGNFEISFSDGNFGFSKVVHRLGNSAHDCIQNAKDAMKPPHPDRGLAVAWVMAGHIHNPPYYEWLRNHGDAVLNALKRIP